MFGQNNAIPVVKDLKMFEFSLVFGLIVYSGVASGSVWILTVPADDFRRAVANSYSEPGGFLPTEPGNVSP